MSEYSFAKDAGQDKISFKNCESLQLELAKLKLAVRNLTLKCDQDTVYVAGSVQDQANLEKIVLFLGNIKGVSKVNTSDLRLVNNVIANKITRFYEVKPKDSLWKIAESIYGATHGDKYKIIFEANKPIIMQPDDLFVGQILRIPNIDLA